MSQSRGTILLVEDEADIRRFLRVSLAAEGYKIVESATGRRGTIDAVTHKPDLAIVDLGLPDFDGVEVIRSIRAWSAMPIIVLSARTQEPTKIHALDSGADDYVTKPFGIGDALGADAGGSASCGTRFFHQPDFTSRRWRDRPGGT
jgi:two-component system, OmpR family, KDP operon response regulator KdpE